MKTRTTCIFALIVLFGLPSAFAQTIKSDDFNAFNLNTGIWTLTDPVGDATLTLVGTNTTNARLSLAIPAGTSHDPFAGQSQFPRIMQPASNSDFVIQTKFESALNAAYQIQGIIVEASPAEFLRFDVYGDGSSTFVYSALGNGGSTIINSNIGAANIQPIYLRVTRAGNDWTLSHSQNGTTWTDETSFSYSMTVTKAGLYVGSAVGGGGAPAHMALIDYFQNNASPITSEDGNSSVVDSLKPLIYNIVTTPSPTSFLVNWKTDEAANGKVRYGFTNAYEFGFISHGNFTTGHSLEISGLAAETTYHYQIISADNGGRADSTADLVAQTGAPFSISNVQLFKTSASATVSWLTGTPTNSKVVYGTTTAYGDSTVDTTRVSSHFLNFTGLLPSTLYHFKVTSTDSASNTVSTLDSTFTTGASTTLVTDEFNAAALDTTKWSFLNPSSDGTQSMTGTQLSLGVPSGSRHDVWTDLNNAPRIRQNCNNADFILSVKYDLGVSQSFQIQGVVVQQDSANFVRFDFNSDGTATNMFAATFTGNTATTRLNQLVVDTNNANPMYMRITRQGALWKQEYSANGSTWTTGVTFYHVLTVTSVALFTGNAAANPAFTSHVDYFRLPQPPTVTVNIRVVLEGAYVASGDSMRTDIRGIAPVSQPYNASPWNYTGLEVVGSIPSNVVDWVLVELRSNTAAGTKVATRAAFLTKTGNIVDTSGTGAVTFVNVNPSNYYVVVHHRNHLSIMTAAAIALSQSSSLYDFSTASTQAFGTSPLKQLNTNVWGLFAGDVNGSRSISAADAVQIFSSLSSTSYSVYDVNLGGIVSTADASIIFENSSKTSQVP